MVVTLKIMHNILCKENPQGDVFLGAFCKLVSCKGRISAFVGLPTYTTAPRYDCHIVAFS